MWRSLKQMFEEEPMWVLVGIPAVTMLLSVLGYALVVMFMKAIGYGNLVGL